MESLFEMNNLGTISVCSSARPGDFTTPSFCTKYESCQITTLIIGGKDRSSIHLTSIEDLK